MFSTMSSWLKSIQILFVVQLSVLLSLSHDQVHFRVIREWNYVNYTWPNNTFYEIATNNGQYISENIVVAGIIYSDGWFYLTMPRMKYGVSATLGRISAFGENVTNPLIDPFPSWAYNKLGDCEVLQNVQNVEIDPKQQMWIIDGGHTASLTNTPTRNCSPKLIIFDLSSNTTLTTHTFSATVASKNDSFLYDLVVDDEFAYITDNSRHDPGIIVFSRKQNHAWKIRHSESMQAESSAAHFKINGISISSPINIAGIAMMPTIGENAVNEDKQIFYCPLSSLHMYSINSSILRNENNSRKKLRMPEEVKNVGLKASQTDGMVMTNQGILYYGLLSDNSIANWNTRTPFESNQKVLSRDSTYIQWTNSFTVDLQGNIIVLINTLQTFIHGSLHINQTNFWILSAYIGQKSYLYSGHYNNTEMPRNGMTEELFEFKRNVSSAAAENQVIVDFSRVVLILVVSFHGDLI